jgi:hypothetical protein
MKLLLFQSMLAALALSTANAAIRVTGSENRNELFKADSAGVSVPIEAREVYLSVTYPSGKEQPATLAVLFEPRSRLYLWSFYSAPRFGTFEPHVLDNMAARGAVAVGNGRIVTFVMGHPDLFVRESSQRASDMDEAVRRSVQESSSELATFEKDTATEDIMVEIGTQIGVVEQKRDPTGGTHFFAPPGHVEPGPYAVHVQAAYVGGKWEVTLSAQFKVMVTLDDRYQVEKVEALNETPKGQDK